MKGEKLYEVLQHLDDDLIVEADPARVPTRKPVRWKGWIPLAAAAAVLVFVLGRMGAFPFMRTDSAVGDRQEQASAPRAETFSATEATKRERIEDATEREPMKEAESIEAAEDMAAESLPQIPITSAVTTQSLTVGAMHAIPSYAPAPVLQATDVLPVYRQALPEEEEMRARGEEVAAFLGFDPASMQYEAIFSSSQEEEPKVEAGRISHIQLRNEEVLITVDARLNPTYTYVKTDPLSTEGGARGTASVVKEEGDKLSALLKNRYGWRNPKAVVTPVSETEATEASYTMFVYETDRDPMQDFLNYSFKTATGSFRWDGNLSSLTLNNRDTLVSLGEYPLRTEEEAKKEIKNARETVRTDLVYEAVPEGIWMPHYAFYVKNGEETTETDEAFVERILVPAIRSEYLEKGSTP